MPGPSTSTPTTSRGTTARRRSTRAPTWRRFASTGSAPTSHAGRPRRRDRRVRVRRGRRVPPRRRGRCVAGDGRRTFARRSRHAACTTSRSSTPDTSRYEHGGPPADFVFTRNALHQVPDFWKAIALDRIRRHPEARRHPAAERPGLQLRGGRGRGAVGGVVRRRRRRLGARLDRRRTGRARAHRAQHVHVAVRADARARRLRDPRPRVHPRRLCRVHLPRPRRRQTWRCLARSGNPDDCDGSGFRSRALGVRRASRGPHPRHRPYEPAADRNFDDRHATETIGLCRNRPTRHRGRRDPGRSHPLPAIANPSHTLDARPGGRSARDQPRSSTWAAERAGSCSIAGAVGRSDGWSHRRLLRARGDRPSQSGALPPTAAPLAPIEIVRRRRDVRSTFPRRPVGPPVSPIRDPRAEAVPRRLASLGRRLVVAG